MLYDLLPHTDFPPLAVRGVTVELEGMHLTYRVDGGERLVLPAPDLPYRTDGLWRTTCFELFLMAGEGPAYVEFNFSPSSQWAA